VDKAGGHEQRLGGFVIGAALAAASHQQGGGTQFGGQFGRQDRLWHRRLSKRPARAGSRHKKPRSRAGQGSYRFPDLLARFFTWRASRSAQITHERLLCNLWLDRGQAGPCPAVSLNPISRRSQLPATTRADLTPERE